MKTTTTVDAVQGGAKVGAAAPLPDEAPRAGAAESQSRCERLAFSVGETAEMLGVSDKSVRRLIARGLLRPSKALRHILIPKKEIVRFLDQT